MNWRQKTLVAASAIGLVLAGMTVPASAQPDGGGGDLVRTDLGPVRGIVGEDFRSFQGIPFAAPPVGELRFRPPQPAQRWREPLDATAPRSMCAQPSQFGLPASDQEDCLYLNVTTPRSAHGRLPVMVWIHGGSFITGAGSQYDARALAVSGDVVVVTVNYRLGPLGFLALPALNEENPGIQSGHLGIMDQQAALDWVRRNAAAFGGNPGNVTIFGESAGGGSVCAQLVSPTAGGLFHKAISQSLSCTEPMVTREDGEQFGAAFAAGLGCTDPALAAACLRTKPAGALVEAWQSNPFPFPVVGGRVLPLQPPDAVRADRFHHVPLMLGNTRDEMRLFVGLQFDLVGNPVTPEQYEEIIRASYGAAADEVLRLYPLSAFPSPSIALATVQTDAPGLLSTCSHLTSYRAFSARPRPVPVYAYQFADRTAPPLIDIPNFEDGAAHAVELSYLFDFTALLPPLNGQQQALSSAMIRYWTNFAHRGNPNGRDLPGWPRFRSSGDVLSLDLGAGGIRPVDTGQASNCAFWESLPR